MAGFLLLACCTAAGTFAVVWRNRLRRGRKPLTGLCVIGIAVSTFSLTTSDRTVDIGDAGVSQTDGLGALVDTPARPARPDRSSTTVAPNTTSPTTPSPDSPDPVDVPDDRPDVTPGTGSIPDTPPSTAVIDWSAIFPPLPPGGDATLITSTATTYQAQVLWSEIVTTPEQVLEAFTGNGWRLDADGTVVTLTQEGVWIRGVLDFDATSALSVIVTFQVDEDAVA